MAALISERWTTGWRGPLLAAIVALFAGLPAAFGLPLTDRHEARTVQGTAQMLESGDFVAINFQDRTRVGEPVGAHWLQAASVALFSQVEARQVFAYRLPSLLAAMLLAAACAWGGRSHLAPRLAAAAGCVVGASLALSLAAGLATAEVCSAAGLVLALSALGRIYATSRGLGPSAPGVRVWFWAGLILAILTGGWLPAAVVVLTGVFLFAHDRSAPWVRGLGWSWGLIALGLVVGPWTMAITVATDGSYWSGASGGSGTWPPPGAPTLGAVLLFFPFTALLPLAAAFAWRERGNPAVRYALAWLAAAWLSIELSPTRSVDDVLPLLPPLAWLGIAGFSAAQPRWARVAGVALSAAVASVLAGFAIILALRYGDVGDAPAAAAGVVGFVVAGGLAGRAVLQAGRTRALMVAAVLGLAANGLVFGGLLPRLEPLWPSQRSVAALRQLGLHPRDGLVQGPVTVAGYAEPSLIFALGARTEVGDVAAAAAAIGERRPVIVEGRQETAFRAALNSSGHSAIPVASVAGLDYADGEPVRLTIWRSTK